MNWGFIAFSMANGTLFHYLTKKGFLGKQLDGMLAEPISIVMPVYNEEKYIAPALISIENAKTTYGSHMIELVVVDNESEDNTLLIASQHADKTLMAPRGKLNALQAGIFAASHDLILTMDADITFVPETLEKIAYHFRDPNTVLVCGHVCESTVPIMKTLRYMVEEAFFTLFKHGSGSFRMLRRNAFLQAGGFDLEVDQLNWPRQPFFFTVPIVQEEEMALPQRMANFGEVRNDPSINIIHRRSLCVECPHGSLAEECVYCQDGKPLEPSTTE